MSYDKKCHKVHVLWTFCVNGLRPCVHSDVWFELHNSNYELRCKFVYTQSKILSFEWSFKLHNLNDHSNCTLLLSCENTLGYVFASESKLELCLIYAVKAQTSLAFVVHALLLRMHTNVVYFRVMRRLCRYEWNWLWNWRCVNQHLWDPWQRTRDHGVWRLTLTAYRTLIMFVESSFANHS